MAIMPEFLIPINSRIREAISTARKSNSSLRQIFLMTFPVFVSTSFVFIVQVFLDMSIPIQIVQARNFLPVSHIFTIFVLFNVAPFLSLTTSQYIPLGKTDRFADSEADV